MPKYIFEEEVLIDYLSDDEKGPDQFAKYKREPDGQLSEYEPAQCALNAKNLTPTAQLALEQLRQLGVTQLMVRYDGGSDEGFAHFQSAKKGDANATLAELVQQLEVGPLGDKPESPFFYHVASQITGVGRHQWTKEAIEGLIYGLAAQLLGDGFGTGDYSLEGNFIADFRTNTLTDIAPVGD